MKTLWAFLLGCLVALGNAQAALYDRGNGMIYDDVLNVTWLQDANYAKTSGYDQDGLMDWRQANLWAANLNYGGLNDWRLPAALDLNLPGCDWSFGGTDCGFNVKTSDNSSFGELAFMFYVTLGNKAYFDSSGVPQSGIGLVDDSNNQYDESLFINLQSLIYWTGTELSSGANLPWFYNTTDFAWAFQTMDGQQNVTGKFSEFYAWAVRDGDVASIPEPASIALLGIGLVGIGFSRRIQRVDN